MELHNTQMSVDRHKCLLTDRLRYGKCVGIGGIACAVTAILPNNHMGNDGHYLSLAVDTDDSRRRVVRSRDKDRVSTDTVHVDARCRLNVIEVDVSVLCDHVDHIVLWPNLSTQQLISV